MEFRRVLFRSQAACHQAPDDAPGVRVGGVVDGVVLRRACDPLLHHLAVQGLDDVAALAYAAQHLLEIINKPPPPGRDLPRQPEPAQLLQPGGAQRLADPGIAPAGPADPCSTGPAHPAPVAGGSGPATALSTALVPAPQ